MIKKITKLAFIFVAVITAFSCKNFMNGGDFLTELEESVWVANHTGSEAKIDSPVSAPDGDYKNASIIISFTKQMNPETLDAGLILTDSAGNSIRDNYNEPVWNTDFTRVILSAKENNLLSVPQNTTINISIKVTSSFIDYENVPVANPHLETFKINSKLDTEKPVFITSKLAKSHAIINETVKDEEGNEIANPKLFIEGELNDVESEDLENFFITNHAKNSICMYLEGHDYGDHIVFANLKYSRVLTESGKSVTEEPVTEIIELSETPEGTLYSSKSITIDLSDSKYSDGVYKLEITLSDAKNNISDETKTFYIVRDTKYPLSYKAVICSTVPDWRKATERERVPVTISAIEDGLTHIWLRDFSDDVFITYKNKSYSTSLINTGMNISYGSSPNDIVETIKDFEFTQNIDNNEISFYFALPEKINNYVKDNPDKSLFISLELFDDVGNSTTQTAYLPGKTEFFLYTIENNEVKLHFEDKQGVDFSNTLNLQNYTVTGLTYVYYAKKTPGTDDKNIILNRNFKYINENDDPYGSYSDLDTFSIADDPDAEYMAVIQTNYVYTRSGEWCGTTCNSITVIPSISKSNINNSAQSFAAGFESITPTATLTPKEKNTGLTTINVDITQFNEPGVKYFYAFSPNGRTTWNYYKSNQFDVNTLINPPERDWYNDNDINVDDHQNASDEREEGFTVMPGSGYQTIGILKVYASKDNSVKVTAEAQLTFNDNMDNNPPEISSWRPAHDLTISADGTSFFTDNGVVVDNEWHDSNLFTYYYAPYQKIWGNDIDVLSTQDILNLPKGLSKVVFNCWRNDDEQALSHNERLIIPVNGLPDGDYMYFFTASDTEGNSVTGTLGKTHIGTFKNKISATYSNNVITATLPLEDNENFEYNTILVQCFNPADSTAPAGTTGEWEQFRFGSHGGGYTWDNKNDEDQRYFASNTMSKADGKLSFTSGTNLTPADTNNFKDVTFETNRYYKLVVTAYDLEPTTTMKINEWGYHDYEEANDSYDAFINETASAPAYMFIPETPDVSYLIEKSDLNIYSDKPVLVNVISSFNNLGSSDSDIDEWERRGRTIYSNVLSPDSTNNNKIPLTKSDITNIIYKTKDTGKRYYAAVYHFANNKAAISNVIEVTRN